MPIIIFVRHGENDYTKSKRLAGRLPGVHLNAEGVKQVEKLVENLVCFPIKGIYSSPLERTMETAQPIASALNLDITLSENLQEVDFGKWQGKYLKNVQRDKLWKCIQETPSLARFPDGESFFEAQHRVIKQIEGICLKFDTNDFIICVSHSDVIKLGIAYYLGLPLDCFQRLLISPASINMLSIGKGTNSLMTMNYVPSLAFQSLPIKG